MEIECAGIVESSTELTGERLAGALARSTRALEDTLRARATRTARTAITEAQSTANERTQRAQVVARTVLARDAERYGWPLRASERRTTIVAIALAEQTSSGVFAALRTLRALYDVQRAETLLLDAHSRVRCARLIALGERWESGLGARAAHTLARVSAHEESTQRRHRAQRERAWMSPIPREGAGTSEGISARALTTPLALALESERMEHCVALYEHACAEEALHLYALSGPREEERSTLGLSESGDGAFTVFALAGVRNARASDAHWRTARAMARAFSQPGPFACGYERARASERREALRRASDARAEHTMSEGARRALRTLLARELRWI